MSTFFSSRAPEAQHIEQQWKHTHTHTHTTDRHTHTHDRQTHTHTTDTHTHDRHTHTHTTDRQTDTHTHTRQTDRQTHTHTHTHTHRRSLQPERRRKERNLACCPALCLPGLHTCDWCPACPLLSVLAPALHSGHTDLCQPLESWAGLSPGVNLLLFLPQVFTHFLPPTHCLQVFLTLPPETAPHSYHLPLTELLWQYSKSLLW
jgi:cation transport ATPase